MAAKGLALVQVPLLARGLWCAYACFRSFARGEHFNRFTALKLRGFGGAACASALASLVATPLAGLLLSWHAPPASTRSRSTSAPTSCC